jgi:hypothetical protein
MLEYIQYINDRSSGGFSSTTMIWISTGKAVLRLLPGLRGRSTVLKRGYSTKPLPADLAGLIPTLEDLGLGSGDNGTFPSFLLEPES